MSNTYDRMLWSKLLYLKVVFVSEAKFGSVIFGAYIDTTRQRYRGTYIGPFRHRYLHWYNHTKVQMCQHWSIKTLVPTLVHSNTGGTYVDPFRHWCIKTSVHTLVHSNTGGTYIGPIQTKVPTLVDSNTGGTYIGPFRQRYLGGNVIWGTRLCYKMCEIGPVVQM